MRPTHWLALATIAAVAPLAAQQPTKPDTMRPGMMGPGMMGQGMMGPGMMQGMMGGMMMEMMPHMMQMQEMMGPMMRGMAFTPVHLLTRKEALGLTAPQVTRLEALRDAAKAAHDAAAADAQTHMQALGQGMAAAKPDTTAAKQHFQAAQAAMAKAQWAMLGAAAQAKAVLTDEQRGRVDGWVDAMQMQMGQMMRMQRMQQMQQMEQRPEERRDEHHPDRPPR